MAGSKKQQSVKYTEAKRSHDKRMEQQQENDSPWEQANEENEENDFTYGTRPGTRRNFFARNRVGVDDDDDEEVGCVVVVGAVI